MWPLSLAVHVLSNQVRGFTGDIDATVSSLQLLRSIINDLKDTSCHWNDLVRDITLILTELDSREPDNGELGIGELGGAEARNETRKRKRNRQYNNTSNGQTVCNEHNHYLQNSLHILLHFFFFFFFFFFF
jgi:hypothetical protein